MILSKPIEKVNAKLVLLAVPLIIFGIFNYEIIPLKFSLLLGFIAFPFVVKKGHRPVRLHENPYKGDKLLKQDTSSNQHFRDFAHSAFSHRFAILAILAMSCLLIIRSNALYYFSTAFILLYLIETYWGRINNLPILLVAVISPVVSTVVYIWSFPIRLKLTDWAVQALQLIGTDITATGNMLTLNGYNFSVDPACMGLKMVVSSLVIAIIIMAYFEKKQTHPISFFKASALLGLVLFLAVFANFIRLLTLVLFYILPENPLHDIVGLISLIFYVLVPFYFLVKFLFRKHTTLADNARPEISSINKFSKKGIAIFSVLLLFQIFTGFQFLEEPIDDTSRLVNFEKAGYEKSITENGVLKLQSEDALIYVKAPVNFFQGSHDPRFCWRGSGYSFSLVKIEAIGAKQVYTAMLKKDTDKIYSAWWYQNNASTSPNEWDW